MSNDRFNDMNVRTQMATSRAPFSFYRDFNSAFSAGGSKIRSTFCIATCPGLSGQIMTWEGKAPSDKMDLLQLNLDKTASRWSVCLSFLF